jgi:hypothetical protein
MGGSKEEGFEERSPNAAWQQPRVDAGENVQILAQQIGSILGDTCSSYAVTWQTLGDKGHFPKRRPTEWLVTACFDYNYLCTRITKGNPTNPLQSRAS